MSLVLYRDRGKGRVAEGLYMDDEQTKSTRGEIAPEASVCVWICFGFPSPHGPATLAPLGVSLPPSPLSSGACCVLCVSAPVLGLSLLSSFSVAKLVSLPPSNPPPIPPSPF